MIPAEKEDVIRPESLHEVDQRDGFGRKLAAVDDVAEKQVPLLRGKPEARENAEQIEDVPVDVADNDDVVREIENDGLLAKVLGHAVANCLHQRLRDCGEDEGHLLRDVLRNLI